MVNSYPVTFIIIPVDLKECSLIVAISAVGQHNSPSPSPRKTSYNITSIDN
jgi:hypothetical protein